jgi:hypothetical protein
MVGSGAVPPPLQKEVGAARAGTSFLPQRNSEKVPGARIKSESGPAFHPLASGPAIEILQLQCSQLLARFVQT